MDDVELARFGALGRRLDRAVRWLSVQAHPAGAAGAGGRAEVSGPAIALTAKHHRLWNLGQIHPSPGRDRHQTK